MTSNYKLFGAIADGKYDVSYVPNGQNKSLPLIYAINGGAPVDCMDGHNRSWPNYNAYSPSQKSGVYIHRTNRDGYAGYNEAKNKAVSTGCLLIDAQHWSTFTNSIGRQGFKLILNRK